MESTHPPAPVSGQAGTAVWNVRVYYEDTDSAGVVYYANYLKFMERARTEWLRGLGFEQDRLATQEGILFAVRSVALDYLRPARFNDSLQVRTSVQRPGRVALVFRQLVLRCGEAERPLCVGRIKVACISAHSYRPHPLPSEILARLTSDR